MRKYLLPLLAATIVGIPLFAHDGHNHEAAVEPAPQGGVLRDAPPFKSEIKIDGDVVKLYIYDQKLKTVKYDKDELQGDVQFPRQKTKPVTFKRLKEERPTTIKDVGVIAERYEAKIPGINKIHRYDMHVNLEVGGKMAKADFGIDNIN